VQFHPEAAAGPKDMGFLFDRFMDMIDKRGIPQGTASQTAGDNGGEA
jgi:hypothetical protein